MITPVVITRGKTLGVSLAGANSLWRGATLALALASAGPTAAQAQSGAKSATTAQSALDAATQPLADLNLRSKDIPSVLRLARVAPYDLATVSDCAQAESEIARLNDVLGPDADAPAAKSGLIKQGLALGGNFLSGFIPFRGAVRQLSGANAHRAEWSAAIYAGVARRSFLKGYARGLGCTPPSAQTPPSAEQVLGIATP